jgi:hypothetical protein
MFSLLPFVYASSPYSERGNDEPAPIYPPHLWKQIQRTLSALADIAAQQEMEREHSNGNKTQRSKRHAA